MQKSITQFFLAATASMTIFTSCLAIMVATPVIAPAHVQTAGQI